MGVQAPPELLGIHTKMAAAVPPEIDKAAFTGAPPPSDLSAEERHAYDQLAAYPKLIYYNKLNKGGHFAAWEQPKLFSEEVRAGFRPLR